MSPSTAPLLAGKKALVTGSSRGIGRACALAFAQAGADLVVHYRRDDAAAAATAAAVRELGRKALVIKADLEDPARIDGMFDEIGREWGSLDILVANAAATAFKPLADLKSHHLDRTYQVVVKSVVQCVQRSLPLMTGGAGRVITLTSPGSVLALPRYANLGMAKAALESLTRYVAAEAGERGVTCNAIAPGVVETDSVAFYAGAEYEAFRKRIVGQTPLRRLTQPADVAALALFLASDLSAFVTGQVIAVDGGLSLTPAGFSPS
ncbi:MAG: SDR family oxidoreductase [Opitutaceae bacterium]